MVRAGKFRNCSGTEKLVRAVGIENTTERNLKELEEMLRSAKELKRNNRKCKGILIGPLMAPRFFDHRDSVTAYFTHCPSRAVGFRLKFCGADGKPTQLREYARPDLVARPGNRSCGIPSTPSGAPRTLD